MDIYYLGQIILFAGSYAPEGFLPCDGRLLPINGNEALYSLIGVTYGGDARTNFGLPDLRGRLPLGKGKGFVDPRSGTGPQLTDHPLGAMGGAETSTLTSAQIPAHTHNFNTLDTAAATNQPGGAMLAKVPDGTAYYIADTPGGPTPTTVPLGASAITAAGGSAVHENRMPTLPMTYIICTQGIYPQPA